MDDESANSILRKRTLILGEESSSPEKTPPKDVQAGKTLPSTATSASSDGQPERQLPQPEQQPAQTEQQPAQRDQPEGKPSEEKPVPGEVGLPAAAPVHQDVENTEPSDANMLGDTSKADTDKPDDTEKLDESHPEDEACESDGGDSPEIDRIPVVKRKDQQAFKDAKKPPKPRGRAKSAPKPKCEPKKGAEKDPPRKRPAAAKPPSKSKKAKGPAPEEEEKESDEAKRDLAGAFAEAADPEPPADKPPAECKGRKRKSNNSDKSEAEVSPVESLPLNGLTTKNDKQRSTFAGRNAPKSLAANNRFTVMLTAFTSLIAPRLKKKSSQVEAGLCQIKELWSPKSSLVDSPSFFLVKMKRIFLLKPFQLLWWNFAFKKLVDSEDQTVSAYHQIAQEEASAFLSLESTKPFLLTCDS